MRKVWAAAFLAGIALAAAQSASAVPPPVPRVQGLASWHVSGNPRVQTYEFTYTTHRGQTSYALLLLPSWYGPQHHPAIPLVICPHGRNTMPEAAARRWFDLPTRGGFAVVLPAGQGRVLQLYSWGWPGQIADLARMPGLAEKAVPYFRYDRSHVYAVGASMGGQEVLLLEARHPHLLAGAVAFDPAVNLANRYYELSHIRFGKAAQEKARLEVGGTPKQVPLKYELRSPTRYARQIAFSGVPTELWWSTRDQVIVNQAEQTGEFYSRLKELNPAAPVVSYVGHWPHAQEDSAFANLPIALAKIGLLPSTWLQNDPLSETHKHPRAAAALAFVPQPVGNA